jgi:hypothetical protein
VAVEAVLLVIEIRNTNECFKSNLPNSVFYDDSLASCLVVHTQVIMSGSDQILYSETSYHTGQIQT